MTGGGGGGPAVSWLPLMRTDAADGPHAAGQWAGLLAGWLAVAAGSSVSSGQATRLRRIYLLSSSLQLQQQQQQG